MGWITEQGQTPDAEIDLGVWWPKIGTKKFFEQYRPPSELPLETVINHLRIAAIAVRRQLLSWQQRQSAASMAEVAQETVDGAGEKILLFERAVYCETKAEILRETLTTDQRKEAENNVKSGVETEEKYREYAADAISMIVDDERIHIGSI